MLPLIPPGSVKLSLKDPGNKNVQGFLGMGFKAAKLARETARRNSFWGCIKGRGAVQELRVPELLVCFSHWVFS